MSDKTPRARRKIAGERTRRTSHPAPDRVQAPAGRTPAGPSDEATRTRGAVATESRDTHRTEGNTAEPPLETLDFAGDEAPGHDVDGAPTDRPAGVTGRGAPTWLMVGIGVLLVAALVFDLIFALRLDDSDGAATSASGEASSTDTGAAGVTDVFNTAPAQAERAAEQVLGYDYQTLRQDADEAKALMTPRYAESFQQTVDDLLRAPATEVKAHVEAKVMASGVAAASGDSVDVLLFVDQTSTTTANTEPQTALNRVVFTMVKDGDRWLVDEITAL